MNTDRCPHCQADLRGTEIPEANRHMYAPGSTHFSRMIGVEIRGAYDGVLFWQCPDCGGRWQRWPEGSSLHTRAQYYIDNPEEYGE